MEDREQAALDMILEWGSVDGAHHKQWLIDQVARTLAGDGYRAWVDYLRDGEDGAHTYEWDEGIAP